MYIGPQRKRLRLENYNYSNTGLYFITICTKNREEFFGEIIDGKMILSECGEITLEEILKTEKLRKEIKIDNFVIMPNHIHLIIVIGLNITVGNAGLHSLQVNDLTKNKLSNTIQRIKSSITSNIRTNFNNFIFAWQKSFFDKIIHTENQLQKTREYILNNPIKRDLDINNPVNIKKLQKKK